MPLILGANSVSGYTVKNSLRFNSGSSDNLSKTYSVSPTSRTTITISTWVKRSNLSGGTTQAVVGTDGNFEAPITFFTDDTLRITGPYMSGQQGIYITNAVYRDVSAWYHIVTQYDTTNATASDRMKLYVNGERITSFSSQTNSNQNNTTTKLLVSGTDTFIGKSGASSFFSGYIAETYIIDGQALTPSSFGEIDTLSGIWIPKAYTGTFGTNGFYLKFADSASLGTDSSGNGNTFTVNNLTSVDQSTDTPTNNFATMNPLTSFGTVTLTEGNLQVSVPDNTANSTSTFMVSSGKWYWEVKPTVGTLAMVGIRPEGMNYNQNSLFNLTGTNQGYYYYGDSGNIRPANTAYGNSFGVGDIIGVALDLDNNKLYFSKNGTFQNSGVPTSGATGTGAVSIATSGLTWGFSFTSGGNIDTIQCNFGNPPYSGGGYTDGAGYGNFSYAVPSGYYALNTKNLANYG